jgi:uncharacterized protein YjbI with pentapeptide repeats
MAVVYTDNEKSKLWPMDSKGGPMLRYIFLSVFALIFLAACGGSDLDQLKESGFKKCRECDLSWADLRGANLTAADLRGSDLRGANLTAADLRGADLSGAVLSQGDLSGADLTGADLTGAKLFVANLTDANLDGVIGADCTGAYNVLDKYRCDALAIALPAISVYEEGPDVQNIQGLKLFLVIFISFGLWVFLTVICNTRTSSEARLTRSGLSSYTANLGWKEYILVFVGCFAFVAGYCYWPEISSLIGL